MDLQKVAADSKRIAEKMKQVQRLTEESKLQNKSSVTGSIQAKENINRDNNDVFCGWREDEDERYRSKEYSSRDYRQNDTCDDNQDTMRAVLHAFFKADHDAAQFEQYKLENDWTQPAEVRQAVSHLKALVNSGLRVLLTVVFIMGAGFADLKAQEIKASPGLKVGDKVPDVTIQNIINYPTSSAKISDFKGKLLILDFWGTYCGSCIEGLGKMTGLNEKFNGRAVILAVTGEKAERVRAFLGTNKKLGGVKLSSVTGDVQLKSMFPHQTVPHMVWISAGGKVLSVTNAEYLTEANITAALAGKPLDWLQRSGSAFDYSRPFARSSEYDGTFYGALTGQVAGAGTKAGRVRIDSSAQRYYAVNHDILHLYALACGRGDLVFTPNRRILQVQDPDRYGYRESLGYHDVWKANNHYSYETVIPPGMKQPEIMQHMQRDLDRFLNLSTRVESRNMPCLVLRLKNPKKLGSATHQRKVALKPAEPRPFIHDARLSVLVEALNQLPGMAPVIDETGFTLPVDIDFRQPLSDLPALKEVLTGHGLELVPDERQLEIFVLEEKALRLNEH